MLTFLIQFAEVLNTFIRHTQDLFSVKEDKVCEMFDLLWHI